MSDANAGDVVVEMLGITKKFGTFVANDQIDLTVRKGEVHALLGENGAGKTTLMNQLYGLYQPTAGEIRVKGQRVHITASSVAIAHGIGMVHQHFMLVQPFTVAENIILGQETCSVPGVLDLGRAERMVTELSERYGLTVSPRAMIRDITVGMQQRVEILKALWRDARLLILDEPTSGLDPIGIREVRVLLESLKSRGMTLLLNSHFLSEVETICDTAAILHRGSLLVKDSIASIVTENETLEDVFVRVVGG